MITGALGSWGAALLKPYSDNPETSGLMLSSPENLKNLVEQFWKDGWQTVCSLSFQFHTKMILIVEFRARTFIASEIAPTMSSLIYSKKYWRKEAETSRHGVLG